MKLHIPSQIHIPADTPEWREKLRQHRENFRQELNRWRTQMPYEPSIKTLAPLGSGKKK